MDPSELDIRALLTGPSCLEVLALLSGQISLTLEQQAIMTEVMEELAAREDPFREAWLTDGTNPNLLVGS